jgi:peptidoglycan/xylan/chitin deacetylase (PgdA/CDA1 family)
MADRDTEGPAGPDPRREQLLARREAQRRNRARARKRQAIALGAGGLAVVAVVAVAALAGGGSNSHDGSAAGSVGGAAGAGPSTTGKASSPAAGRGEGSDLVRNATPQAGWEPHTGPVPILEYHVLGAPAADVSYPELYVSRPDFHQQMDWLDQRGYQAVTLEEVEDAWYSGGSLPAKPVVISFDDGYRPQFTYALPELRRHGWPGVLNLKAEGSDLYESNVEAMIAAGWELAAHTIDHSDLTTLGDAELKRETAGAREILRREYGVPVKDFCYPSGQFDATVIAAVEAAGYVTATTEIPGYATRDAPYELARFEILGSTGVSGMAADLASG